ncbi:MAG: type II toxin-antitoxin system RelE/ParE family toxin [Rickettsiales bacterium]|jgi:mRNA interferase RelE/StbE|nr:type II toxin-antitoxin system RelE/ParE family toxin [Rickettsiales bacterium]
MSLESNWTVEIADGVSKKLKKLDTRDRERIIDFFSRIRKTSDPMGLGNVIVGSRKFRYRVGDYGIVCEILNSHKIIRVIDIGHRSEIYKNLLIFVNLL